MLWPHLPDPLACQFVFVVVYAPQSSEMLNCLPYDAPESVPPAVEAILNVNPFGPTLRTGQLPLKLGSLEPLIWTTSPTLIPAGGPPILAVTVVDPLAWLKPVADPDIGAPPP